MLSKAILVSLTSHGRSGPNSRPLTNSSMFGQVDSWGAVGRRCEWQLQQWELPAQQALQPNNHPTEQTQADSTLISSFPLITHYATVLKPHFFKHQASESLLTGGFHQNRSNLTKYSHPAFKLAPTLFKSIRNMDHMETETDRADRNTVY